MVFAEFRFFVIKGSNEVGQQNDVNMPSVSLHLRILHDINKAVLCTVDQFGNAVVIKICNRGAGCMSPQ